MFGWFFKAHKTLHIFSGEDINIINKLNDPKLNVRFNLIGLLVMIICIGCLFSSAIFILNILDGADKLWSVPIGVFWGFSVTMIYILLLYTITPPLLLDRSMLLKSSSSKNSNKILWVNLKKLTKWFSASMLLRIGFILIFSLIIAQPINYMLFNHLVKTDIEVHKMNYKSDLIYLSDSSSIVEEKNLYQEFHSKLKLFNFNKSDSLNLAEKTLDINQKNLDDQKFLLQSAEIKFKIDKISKKINKKSEAIKNQLIEGRYFLTQEQINSDSLFLSNGSEMNFMNVDIQNLYLKYFQGMNQAIEKKHFNNQNVSKLIDSNRFYLRSIIFLNQKSLVVKVFNLLFVLLFVVPIYFKIEIRRLKLKNNPGFYEFKEKYEVDFVTSYYKSFKLRFEEQLRDNYRFYHQRALTNLQKDLEILQSKMPKKAELIKFEISNRYQYKVELYEKYLDPPFNLKDKNDHRVEYSEDYFLRMIEEKTNDDESRG